MDQITKEKMIAMRKDGYSANMIATEFEVARNTVHTILQEAGYHGREKGEDALLMRCAKCKVKGHQAAACPTGDALDQLDAAEGWVGEQSPKVRSINEQITDRILAGENAVDIAIAIPGVTIREVEEKIAWFQREGRI